MAFNQPTLPQLIERIASDIESRLDGTDPRMRRTVLGVLGRTLAGASHGMHGHLGWISRQCIPNTAEAAQLERWAYWLGRGMSPLKAAAATGSVTVSGSLGAEVPAGTRLQRGDGVGYTTDAAVTLDGEPGQDSYSATVAVTAESAGQEGTAVEGVALLMVSPVAGIQSAAVVAAGGITGGADKETDAALLQRLREYVAGSANGANLEQYVAWAREVPGVTRAWAFDGWLGLGTVVLFFVRDDDDVIIPDAAEVATVQAYIDARRPPGLAGFSALAPVGVAVDMTIQLSPNTSAVQDAVLAELDDLMRREAVVEDGSGSGTVLLTHIGEAISRAEGEVDHVLATPASNVVLSAGQIAVLGAVSVTGL
jgi:uncharacterized phage protein gp47/JayE